MSEAKSTKELMEMLEGIKLVGVSAKKVMADGKVNLEDLPIVMSLATQAKVIADAVAGANEIPAEVKDLQPEEIQALVAKILEVAAAIKAA